MILKSRDKDKKNSGRLGVLLRFWVLIFQQDINLKMSKDRCFFLVLVLSELIGLRIIVFVVHDTAAHVNF